MIPRIALVLVFSSTAAMGEDPPDYIGLSAKAERLAVAVTSAKSCVRFGYADPQQALSLKAQQLVDDAELAGMPGSSADLIVVGAIEAENKRQAARVESLKQNASDQAAVEQFFDYWERRCKSLADDPVYGPHFRP